MGKPERIRCPSGSVSSEHGELLDWRIYGNAIWEKTDSQGMFRGFFPNDDVFTKFRLAFRQILIKFLPSRKEGDSHLELDPRLIDLFLDLKSAKPEFDSDVADQVEDLICFVLDNFKFHGEQIAIDEVDLDAVCSFNKELSIDDYRHTRGDPVLSRGYYAAETGPCHIDS